MTTELSNANIKPKAFEEHFHQSQQDLYESSGNLLMDVEKKKGKMPAEIYVEFRHYLNSVNDALERAAEAAQAKQWVNGREHIDWAETLLTYIKLALAMDISVSEVMNRWKTKQ